jgi:hypothetical protein
MSHATLVFQMLAARALGHFPLEEHGYMDHRPSLTRPSLGLFFKRHRTSS